MHHSKDAEEFYKQKLQLKEYPLKCSRTPLKWFFAFNKILLFQFDNLIN